MTSSRTVLLSAILCSLIFNLGCSSFWHEMQPHRLNRLNRGPAPSLDPEFSYRSRDTKTKLAKKDASSRDAKLSVNSAEIAHVRAQSPTAR